MSIKVKFSLIISLLILPILLFTACNNNYLGSVCPGHYVEVDPYKAFVTDFSDSVTGLEHKVELDCWQAKKRIDPTAEKTVTITINDETVQGTYAYTDRDFPNNFDTRIYYSDNNFQFGLDENDTLQFYFWGDAAIDPTNKTVCTQEECLAIAKQFIQKHIALSITDNYKIETKSNEDRGLYTFTFTKHLGDYITTDQATVTIHQSGALYSFSSFMFNKIPNYVEESSHDMIIEAVEKKLDEIYQEVAEQYVKVEYSEPEIYYTHLDDGVPAYYCVIDITFTTNSGDHMIETSERFGLIVKKII